MLCRDLVQDGTSQEAAAEAETDWDMEIDVVGLDSPVKTGDHAYHQLLQPHTWASCIFCALHMRVQSDGTAGSPR